MEAWILNALFVGVCIAIIAGVCHLLVASPQDANAFRPRAVLRTMRQLTVASVPAAVDTILTLAAAAAVVVILGLAALGALCIASFVYS